jgi:hypothetical protein
MSECPFCDRENPPDIGSCTQCGFGLGLSEPSWPDTPEIELSAAAEQQIRPLPLEPVPPPAEHGVEHADDPKRGSDGVVAEQAAATLRPGVLPSVAEPIAAPVETGRAAMGEERGWERHPGRRWAGPPRGPLAAPFCPSWC